MNRDELTAWLRLVLTPHLGAATQRRLLAAFGMPQQVLAAPKAQLRELLTPTQCQALVTPPAGLMEQVDATLAWLAAGEGPQGPTRRLFTLADARYPAALLQTEDPPLLLHAMGETLAHDEPPWPAAALAVVGSRNPTPQGAADARHFSRGFAQAGWTVVSGLALGVDAAAHEGALEGAAPAQLATVAVVGTGLDRVYPRQHRDLAHRICKQGLVISEFTLGTPPLQENFPRRNRLIAALSQATVVVEAALQSGSLITARLASELGRDVFALPGSIHAPQSRGCHALIKQGAQLVESLEDVLGNLPAHAPAPTTGLLAHAPAPVSDEALEARIAAAGGGRRARSRIHASGPPATPPQTCAAGDPVLDALGHAPASLDALLARTGLPLARLQARLLELELQGQVGRLPGGLFQRIHLA